MGGWTGKCKPPVLRPCDPHSTTRAPRALPTAGPQNKRQVLAATGRSPVVCTAPPYRCDHRARTASLQALIEHKSTPRDFIARPARGHRRPQMATDSNSRRRPPTATGDHSRPQPKTGSANPKNVQLGFLSACNPRAIAGSTFLTVFNFHTFIIFPISTFVLSSF